MAVVTKDIAAVAAKWVQRASAAGADYTAGVKATQKDWSALTAAAQPAWQTGTAEAAAQGRFAAGVTKAGTETWRNAAATKGSVRYPDGVSRGAPKYGANFGPFLDTIKSVSLPPRNPRGAPGNIDRVRTLADALHRKRTGT